jgi:hypothetical protein
MVMCGSCITARVHEVMRYPSTITVRAALSDRNLFRAGAASVRATRPATGARIEH